MLPAHMKNETISGVFETLSQCCIGAIGVFAAIAEPVVRVSRVKLVHSAYMDDGKRIMVGVDEQPINNWYIPSVRPVSSICLNGPFDKLQEIVGKDPQALSLHIEIMQHFTITYVSANDRRAGGTLRGVRTHSHFEYSCLYLVGIVVLSSAVKMILR